MNRLFVVRGSRNDVLVAPGLPQEESVMRMSPLMLPRDLPPPPEEGADLLLSCSSTSAVG